MTDFQEKENDRIRKEYALFRKIGWMDELVYVGKYSYRLGFPLFIIGFLGGIYQQSFPSDIIQLLQGGAGLTVFGLFLRLLMEESARKCSIVTILLRRGMDNETAWKQVVSSRQGEMAIEEQGRKYISENKEGLAAFHTELQKILVEKYHFASDAVEKITDPDYIYASDAVLKGQTPHQVAYEIHEAFRRQEPFVRPEPFNAKDWIHYYQARQQQEVKLYFLKRVVLLFLLAFLYGVAFDVGYVISSTWRNIAEFFAMACALSLGLFLGYFEFKINRPKSMPQTDKGKMIMAFKLLSPLFMPLFIYFMVFIAVGYGSGKFLGRIAASTTISKSFVFVQDRESSDPRQYCLLQTQLRTVRGRFCPRLDLMDSPDGEEMRLKCKLRQSRFGTWIWDCRADKTRQE
jgi:hypothetical protein